jgi:hypothetical protein
MDRVHDTAGRFSERRRRNDCPVAKSSRDGGTQVPWNRQRRYQARPGNNADRQPLADGTFDVDADVDRARWH